MIVVRPKSFTKVAFDAEQIATLAQRSLEGVAALPDDLDLFVDVDEDQATNRVRVDSLSPLTLAVDGGAIEHYKAPRTVVFGDLPKTSTGKIQKFKLREKAQTL